MLLPWLLLLTPCLAPLSAAEPRAQAQLIALAVAPPPPCSRLKNNQPCCFGWECCSNCCQRGRCVPRTPNCITQANPCTLKRCPRGTKCQLHYPLCFTKPCPLPTAVCTSLCTVDKCPLGLQCKVTPPCTAAGPPAMSPQAVCPVPKAGSWPITSCSVEDACGGEPCPPRGVCFKPPTCLDLPCPAGQRCVMRMPPCDREVPCYEMPTCVNNDPCAGVTCASGYVCRKKQVICKTAPCYPVGECVLVGCESTVCPVGSSCTLVYPPCARPPPDEITSLFQCNPVPICVDPCQYTDCLPGTVCQIKNKICFPSCAPETECVPIECQGYPCPIGSHCAVRPYDCNDMLLGQSASAMCIRKMVPYCEPNKDPCDQCGQGTVCRVTDVVCVRAPCPPLVECVPADPCGTNPCPPGQHCEVAYPKCPPTPGQALPAWCQGPTYSCVADDPCAKCPPHTTCKVTQIWCIRAPCDPLVECVPNNPCGTSGRCPPGFSCQPKEIFSIPSQPPVLECVAEPCVGFTCPLGCHCQSRPYPVSDGIHPIDPLPPSCVPDDNPCARCGRGMNCVRVAGQGSCSTAVKCVPKPCWEISCPPGQVCKAPGFPCSVPCVSVTGCYSSSIIG